MNITFLSKDEAQAAALPAPDIYYTPEYGASAELIDGGVWEAAISDDGAMFFPYIRRDVEQSDGNYDAVSPYGYGSFIAPDAADRREFVRACREQGRRRGLVAEFIRTNPFDVTDPARDGLDVDSARAHGTFVVELTHGVDGYWSACEGRHRTAVRKAEREGVTVASVERETLLDASSAFRRLYTETMERVGSPARLKLGDEYFHRLVDGVAEHVAVLDAVADDEVVASAIFMAWGDRLHYHLSGSTQEGMRRGATNAVLDHAVRYLLPEGGALHLGGGLRPDDGLHRFKRSVATRPASVFLCATVVDRVRYDDLTARLASDPETSYFPAYRS